MTSAISANEVIILTGNASLEGWDEFCAVFFRSEVKPSHPNPSGLNRIQGLLRLASVHRCESFRVCLEVTLKKFLKGDSDTLGFSKYNRHPVISESLNLVIISDVPKLTRGRLICEEG